MEDQSTHSSVCVHVCVCVFVCVCCCVSDVSQDEAFVDEIRVGLRFIASVLLRRIQKASVRYAFNDGP